ncbi:hypothetical protein [Hymenobacter metallicola]|uniref:STAS/SEC14 domain-containing protein n=1 Tax=Hymenobacter metallicola TaxID=2563114 RepID=A0A4Z0QB07_9BACT|nr:hypothetical protein [Hymenobacter metallicola]TGE26646.1 hypothetical protein E5K02_17855 [Hymenobacter metallicola]
MSVPSTELDFVRLSYRSDLRIFFMRWTRLVSSQEHRAGYKAALEFARQHEAAHWLIDLRIRGLAEAEDFTWIIQEFRQMMQRALPGAVFRVAYLVTPYHQELIDSRLPAHEATFRTFIEEQTAYQWLGVPLSAAR